MTVLYTHALDVCLYGKSFQQYHLSMQVYWPTDNNMTHNNNKQYLLVSC